MATKVGLCKYNAIKNIRGDKYTQVGYISCENGGPLWNKQITITNNGDNTVYVGLDDNKQEIDSGDDITIKYGNIDPNIFIDKTSDDKIVNLKIIT